ncbi:MAG: thiamine-phosphate kinase [Thaumarchaeota archaeon]|nr:thiamine-phosphate kinase [Nitrososphaerota archaeon]
MARLDETGIIELFVKTLGHPKSPFSRIGDDVPYFPSSGDLTVLKSDMLVAKTDVPKQMKLWQASRKSVIMCASDMLVKGATPLCFMLSLGIPRTYKTGDIRDLAKGVKMARDELGIEFVGGDTNECDDLVIDCTMLGSAKSIVTRAGAHVGDAVYVSGEFGLTPSGLKILQKGFEASAEFKERALQSVLMPKVKTNFASIIRDYATASIDSSDGLALSLHQIVESSNVEIELEELPFAKGVKEFAKANNTNADTLVLYGGEEYEMVFCVNRENTAKVERACKELGHRAIRIGVVKKGSGVFLNGSKVERKGWIHFKSHI